MSAVAVVRETLIQSRPGHRRRCRRRPDGCALCARAGAMGAYLNVHINCAGLDDEAFKTDVIKKVEDLKQQGALTAKDQLTILIKPDATSTYEDLVNILDEMNINDVRVYAIVDITDVDKEFIQATETANAE